MKVTLYELQRDHKVLHLGQICIGCEIDGDLTGTDIKGLPLSIASYLLCDMILSASLG